MNRSDELRQATARVLDHDDIDGVLGQSFYGQRPPQAAAPPAKDRPQHADHFRAFFVDGHRVEIIDLDIVIGPHRVGEGAGIFRELHAPQLRDILDTLNVGDITEVLRTQRGYQILKLESRTDAKLKNFEEARGDIANRIGEQKMRVEREKYLERLREQATITWRNAELQKAYETALARRREAAAANAQAPTTN